MVKFMKTQKLQYGYKGTALVLLSVSLLASAQALTVSFAPGVSATSETPWITCPRDNDGDVCRTTAYCSPDSKNSSSAIYSDAWLDFKANNAGWTLIDGGALQGTLTIDKFKAYSDCPDNQGVEIKATFKPAGTDPVDWRCAPRSICSKNQRTPRRPGTTT